jgi:hypothetical protein
MGYAPAVVPVVVTSVLFTTIVFITICLRMYTRVIMLKNAGANDYLMLAAIVSRDPMVNGGTGMACSEMSCGFVWYLAEGWKWFLNGTDHGYRWLRLDSPSWSFFRKFVRIQQ